MKNKSIGIRELKTHLSKYLRRVKDGETIIITERGQPIGRILPVEESLDERIHALKDAGLVAWNEKELKLTKPTTVNRSKRLVSDLLVEMRE